MHIFNSRTGRARAALAVAVLLSKGAFADQIYWTGLGETSYWDDPANWGLLDEGALPQDNQDAINNTGAEINYQTGDSYVVNSFTTNGLFVMAGGTLSGRQPGISTLEVDDQMEMYGATVSNFVINSAVESYNGDGVLISSSTSNYFNDVTSNTSIDMGLGGSLQVTNGLTLGSNAVAAVAEGGYLTFDNTEALSGGHVFFNGPLTNYLTVEGNSTLTINGTLIDGTNAVFGFQRYASGANTIINNGTISADNSGGTFTLESTNFTNAGTLSAANGGELLLSTSIANAGGNINVGSGSTVLVNNVSITGGTINGPGSLTFADTNSNVLTGVTSNANFDLTNGTRVRIDSGLSLNSANSINLDNNAFLTFDNTQSFATGTINFGADSTQYLTVEGTSVLTLGSGATLQGANAILGYQMFASGANTITNNGLISANTAGGTITFEPTVLNNAGTIKAINGGSLTFNINSGTNSGTIFVDSASSAQIATSGTGLDNTGGTISIAGTFTFSNATVSNGTISGTGSLTAIDSVANILTNVNETAPISLTNGGRITLNSSTLAANANLDNEGVLLTEGTSTFLSGTTTFGGDSTQYISVEGGSTLTINAPAIIHGTTGVLGYEFLVGGANTINNHGTISADVSGGTITIEPSNFSNDGTVQAIGGGEINLISTNSANSHILSASGTGSLLSFSTTLDNTGGTISTSSGGTILLNTATISSGNISGTGSLTANGGNSNILNNVSESAPINLSNGGRIIFNGSTLAANASLDNEGIFFVEGASTFLSGTTTFGGDSTQYISVEGGSSLTIDAPAIIHGTAGVLGYEFFVGGANTITNHGTISADVSGGTITIQPTTFSNDGTIQALSGGTLLLNSNVTNAGGIIHAGSGATVEFNSITVTGGTLTGPGDLLFTNATANVLDNVTVNGNLDLSGPGRVQLLDNLALTGNINVANGGILFISNTQTLSTGNIILEGNANMSVEGNTAFTLGSNASIVATSPINTIGYQYLVSGAPTLINHGAISAFGTGATLSLLSYTPITNTGFITAGTGTTITDSASITNTGGKITASSGGTFIFSSVTVTGGTLSGPGDLFFTNASANIIDGITVNGNLDLTGPGRAQLTDGLNLTGSVNMDNGAILFAINSETITGGTINFGGDGTQNLSIEGNSILTLSSSTVIHGTNGSIGYQFFTNGTNGLINHGTIDANVSGAAFSILAPLTNTGTVHAAANALLTMSQGESQTAGSTTADGTITISAGGLALSGGTVSGNGTLSVTGPMTWSGGGVTGNGLLLANSGLSISNSVVRSGQGLMMVANGFSMASGATLDLTQSDLVINYTSTGVSPIGTIATALTTGYNHGLWNGIGIKSSNGTLAAGTSLGYGDNAVLGYTTFDSQPVAADSVFVKYTWMGDANLDGKVNSADLAMLNAGAAGHLIGWINGDFNYDGVVNSDDFALFMLGSARQTGTLAPAVPEPAILGIVLLPFLQRRRTHS